MRLSPSSSLAECQRRVGQAAASCVPCDDIEGFMIALGYDEFADDIDVHDDVEQVHVVCAGACACLQTDLPSSLRPALIECGI